MTLAAPGRVACEGGWDVGRVGKRAVGVTCMKCGIMSVQQYKQHGDCRAAFREACPGWCPVPWRCAMLFSWRDPHLSDLQQAHDAEDFDHLDFPREDSLDEKGGMRRGKGSSEDERERDGESRVGWRGRQACKRDERLRA